MNTTMSRNLIRFVAAPVAAAGIIGGAALGFSALANASTAAAAPTACTYTGNATQCQTPGNVQINTVPDNAGLDAAQQQYPFFGYGYEGALLFHHSDRSCRLTRSTHSGRERSFDPALSDPTPTRKRKLKMSATPVSRPHHHRRRARTTVAGAAI